MYTFKRNKNDTDPNLPPVVSKPYPLTLKHHKFVKDEIETLLEAGLIKRPMTPCPALKVA